MTTQVALEDNSWMQQPSYQMQQEKNYKNCQLAYRLVSIVAVLDLALALPWNTWISSEYRMYMTIAGGALSGVSLVACITNECMHRHRSYSTSII